jgi:hypothetical protein
MSRLFSILMIILFILGSPASSWSPPDAHMAHPSTLSKDLSHVKRIWHLPDNPEEPGNVWGIQSRGHVKIVREGPLAPQQRAPDTYLELVQKNTPEVRPEAEEEEGECEDYYYDGMSGDAFCWII